MKFVKSLFGFVLMCSFYASAEDTPTAPLVKNNTLELSEFRALMVLDNEKLIGMCVMTPSACKELTNVTIRSSTAGHLVFVIENAGLDHWQVYHQIEKAIMGYSESTGYQCIKTYSKTNDDLIAQIDCRLAD